MGIGAHVALPTTPGFNDWLLSFLASSTVWQQFLPQLEAVTRAQRPRKAPPSRESLGGSSGGSGGGRRGRGGGFGSGFSDPLAALMGWLPYQDDFGEFEMEIDQQERCGIGLNSDLARELGFRCS